MIRLQQLSLMRGTKSLFEAVDLTLNPGEKIGLIGANGSGKSTLFAMLRVYLTSLKKHPHWIDLPSNMRLMAMLVYARLNMNSSYSNNKVMPLTAIILVSSIAN